MSEITKSVKTKKNILGVISFLLNVGPLLGVLIYCFASGEIKTKEGGIALGLVFVFTLFISVVNVACKWHLRTPLWIMIFALIFIVSNLMVILFIIGGCTIIDELIISPLHKRYKEKYKINREIDKRLPNQS